MDFFTVFCGRIMLNAFWYDNDETAIEAVATDIATSQDTTQSVFSATGDSGNLRVTLLGKVCTDTESSEPYRTTLEKFFYIAETIP